jgi:Ca2+-binding EF-hand superfamily protein
MRTMTGIALAAGLFVIAPAVHAQPPDRDRGGTRAEDVNGFVTRMMAFDKNKDGKLTRDEVTDERLLRLFDRADANKDGVVTKEELVALFEKESRGPSGGRSGPPDGPGGRGRGGPRAGQVLPEFLQADLDLTPEQKKQIAELQKEVDGRLDRILTRDQKARLRQPQDRRPGGPDRPMER